jgi:rubrerythrin
MTGELSKKLVICIAIEATTAEIYRKLARMFRGTRDFWSGLEDSENKHVKILLAAGGYLLDGKMPDHLVPPSLPEIDETYLLVDAAKKRVEGKRLSLKEALEMSLRMENAVGERYLQELMKKEDGSVVISELRRICADEKLHSEMISDFLESSGLS